MSELLKGSDDLTQAIAELKSNPFSPEGFTNYWRAKFQGERDITVPDCNWTEKEIRKPMVDIRGKEGPSMMVYVSKQLIGKEGLIRLGKMYPQMADSSVRENTLITDTHRTTGWIKVEATIDNAPNGNTRQKDLEDLAKRQGYLGQRVGTYILVSQASKDLTEHYLDELDEVYIWSRLLGSRRGGRVVNAYFYSDGRLIVGRALTSRSRHPALGGRFEEVEKNLTIPQNYFLENNW